MKLLSSDMVVIYDFMYLLGEIASSNTEHIDDTITLGDMDIDGVF